MTRPLLSVLLSVLTLVGPAEAADWKVVAKSRDKQVEIDQASIIDSDGGTKVAWGRVSLSPADAAGAGYAEVKALNRYDCAKRTFQTVKRVYLDGDGLVLREERVTDLMPQPVAARSVDESLWREVCKPPSAADMRKLAEAASEAAGGEQATPAARPAALAEEPAKSPAPAATSAAAERPAVIEPPTRAAAAARAARGGVPEKPKPLPPMPPAPTAGTSMRAPRAAAEEASKLPERPSPKANPGSPAAPRPAEKSAPAGRTRVAPEGGAAAAVPAAEPARDAAYAAARPADLSAAPRPPAPRASARGGEKEEHAPGWHYEGPLGPEHWGRLKPEWATCDKGQRQSPVDLVDGFRVDLEPVRFDYRDSLFSVVDNGHTVQVSPAPGNFVEIRGSRYALQQFHFHRPAEERIDGRRFEMNVHLVHQDAAGRLAVVAVLFERGREANPAVQTVWNNLPLERGQHFSPQSVSLNPASLLPALPEHFLYMGSLTTPPCTEGVTWVVMKQPLALSDEQMDLFSRLYPMNARPPQPVSGRMILESR